MTLDQPPFPALKQVVKKPQIWGCVPLVSTDLCLYHLLVGWLSALWCAVVDRELWCASGISCVTFDTQSVFTPCLHELFHRSADLVRAFLGPFSPFHPKQRGNNKTKRHRAVKFTYSSSEAVKLMIKR